MSMASHELGFKCGIEIHQQLEGKKLFCSCPTLNSSKEPDIRLERRLRAVAGETGDVDVAAKHEMAKSKRFIYLADSADCCIVEMDEEPPHPINHDALNVAIEVAMLLNARLVDEIQVMRKTVVDGSNVSGFQRTALVAHDGYVDTLEGGVGVPIICLEEEAAQKIEEDDDSVTYRLDRLGIPLIEIATDASIRSPQHAKEVAQKLGMILRSTGKVKRGIGTIRQDVNCSIKGGARTEIKGFQELKSIPKVIEYEVERQLKLIKQGKRLKNEVRKAEPDGTTSFLRPMPGAARMYPETDVVPVVASTEGIEVSELIEEKAEKYKEEYGLGRDLAHALAKSAKSTLFDTFVPKYKKVKPAFIAETLISAPREIRRKHNVDVDSLADEQFDLLMSLLDTGRIPKDSINDALIQMVKGTFKVDAFEVADTGEIEEFVKKVCAEKKELGVGAIMGIVMGKYRGKVDGKTVSELVKRHLG
jgi:Glu-tRNA(Gln) amidotransferase subunit E-like FAD-binding protein